MIQGARITFQGFGATLPVFQGFGQETAEPAAVPPPQPQPVPPPERFQYNPPIIAGLFGFAIGLGAMYLYSKR